jgi:hypothetical protein
VPWWPKFDPAYVPPDELAIFDRSLATLRLDGRDVGLVAFRLNRLAEATAGHLWWTRYAEPVDAVDWLEVQNPGTDEERFDDGIERLPSALVAGAHRGEWFTVIDGERVTVGLHFLSGDERERLWTLYGWSE